MKNVVKKCVSSKHVEQKVCAVRGHNIVVFANVTRMNGLTVPFCTVCGMTHAEIRGEK
jgi:hypothetical protein